jgi:hypothetical protein
LTIDVTQASTTTALAIVTSAPNNVASLTFTATVSSTQANGETGTVNFYAGAQLLDTAPLNAGTATYTTTATTFASNSFTAVYSGDTNFLGSTSTRTQQSGDFVLNSASLSIATAQGGMVQALITLTPLYNFSGTLTMSCSGLPANSLCRFQPTTLVVSGTAPVTETVQIFTNLASNTARNEGTPFPGSPHTPWIVTAGIFFLPGAFLLAFRRSRHGLLGLSLLIACCLGLMMLNGCSGSGTTTQLVTPAGTQNVTITFTGAGVTHSLVIPFTVNSTT